MRRRRRRRSLFILIKLNWSILLLLLFRSLLCCTAASFIIYSFPFWILITYQPLSIYYFIWFCHGIQFNHRATRGLRGHKTIKLHIQRHINVLPVVQLIFFILFFTINRKQTLLNSELLLGDLIGSCCIGVHRSRLNYVFSGV